MADVDGEFKENPGISVDLEGDITVPGAPDEEDDLSTLDEPVRVTVLRDVKAVGKKFVHVLWPKESRALLREWDLWGPLILCIFLAMMLQGSTKTIDSSNDGGPQFAEVFVIYWVGAFIVTLNIKLLGGSISFFQSVCVLGYCVLPLAVSLIVCRIILLAETQSVVLFIIRCVVVLIAFGWSTFASTAFLSESQPPKRKALAVYPIFLFYFVISWLVISHTHT
ncbi:DgyrCDS4079 [Dimorphilus gyrociliatus]|uniref:Protein YIPF n=1 Tax=Dimorphilus gyrociliatus TaxID=2664684 RepID=A0A7I8VHZ9_9ANNE|nr:DgyrCDS4079 [Dimorphilus gyrociliatus]